MLLHNENLREFTWLDTSFEITKALNKLYTKPNRKDSLQNEHILIQYLLSFTKA
jgi:hypothetical protein